MYDYLYPEEYFENLKHQKQTENDPDWAIIDVVSDDNYVLTITFITGEKKLYDCKPIIEKFKVFEPLKNLGFFKRVRAGYDCVMWNEKLDLAAETLYSDATPIE